MISHILINSLGEALFESCVQGMLIFIALQVFLKLFPSISSKYKYLVQYFALSAMCVWFLFSVAKIYGQTADVAAYQPSLNYYPLAYTGQVAPTLLQQAKALISQYSLYIFGLYVLGLIVHIIGLTRGLINVGRIRSKKNLGLNPMWTQRAAILREKLGMLKNVPIYISEHIHIPLTIGHLKPIIIFPLALINNLDADQTEAILLHELAHIKRHDYLFNLIQTVMETILCFNPFCWLIAKVIRNEREYCCDDMVTEAVESNHNYAKALYLIAQQNTYRYALAMASTGESKYPLLNRIKRLNHMKTKHQLPTQHLAVIITISVISMLLAWAVPQYTWARNNKARKTKIIVNPIPQFENNSLHAHLGKLNTGIKSPKKVSMVAYIDSLKPNDTIKKAKNKYKIVVEDEKGEKKEYDSMHDMPGSLRHDLEMSSLSDADRAKMDSLQKHFSSPEWKKEMEGINRNAMEMTKKFNSPQWKKQQKRMVEKAIVMSKKINSSEFKKQQEEMVKNALAMSKQFDSPEWKQKQEEWAKMGEDMAKKFNSPEWKQQQEDMVKSAEKMAEYYNSPEGKKKMEELVLTTDAMSKKFNSPEWKKQEADLVKNALKMSKQFNSPEFKKQQKELVDKALKMSKEYSNPEFIKKQEELEKKMKDLEKQQEELQKQFEKDEMKTGKTTARDTTKQ